MNLIKYALIFTAGLIWVIFTPGHIHASPAVTVQKISESALDELIHTKNNKMVITFMAAWCGPCIDELPALNKIYNRFKARGLNLIGISIDPEGPGAMQPIIDKLQISFPVYWYGASAVQKFSLFVIPMILFVKDARIVGELPGRQPEKQLTLKIQEFLDQ